MRKRFLNPIPPRPPLRRYHAGSPSRIRHHGRLEDTVTPRLVQLSHKGARHVAFVGKDDASLVMVRHTASIYLLALKAFEQKKSLYDVAIEHLGSNPSDVLSYDEALEHGEILPPIEHPNPRHFWVTGTGLAHFEKSDVLLRANKPAKGALDQDHLAESVKQHQLHEVRGKHKHDRDHKDITPDWFFKGDGSIIVGPEKPLRMPSFALSGSEEAELVGLYLNDTHGVPHRIGFTLGNEFSDHASIDKAGHVHPAHGKIRPCSIGPELYLGDLPPEVRGKVRIVREGAPVWSATFLTGTRHLAFPLEELEHSHFKHSLFRKPGDLHAHFLGSSIVSFSSGFKARPGDQFEIEADIFAFPLRNSLEVAPLEPEPLHQLGYIKKL